MNAWPDALLLGFAYDSLSDRSIGRALADTRSLAMVDPDLDWEADLWLAQATTIRERDKHAYRVARLVQCVRGGAPIRTAIELDTYNIPRCYLGIGNGHHRVRALQYMGLSCGPFSLSGCVDSLERLVGVAGCAPPAASAGLFLPALLKRDEFDI